MVSWVLAPLSWQIFGNLGLDILVPLSWLIIGKLGLYRSPGTVELADFWPGTVELADFLKVRLRYPGTVALSKA